MSIVSVGKKVLITLNKWIMMPDGDKYLAIYGTVRGTYTNLELFDVASNTWWIKVGSVLVPGTDIDSLVLSDTCHFGRCNGWTADAEHGVNEYETPCQIYNADQ